MRGARIHEEDRGDLGTLPPRADELDRIAARAWELELCAEARVLERERNLVDLAIRPRDVDIRAAKRLDELSAQLMSAARFSGPRKRLQAHLARRQQGHQRGAVALN